MKEEHGTRDIPVFDMTYCYGLSDGPAKDEQNFPMLILYNIGCESIMHFPPGKSTAVQANAPYKLI